MTMAWDLFGLAVQATAGSTEVMSNPPLGLACNKTWLRHASSITWWYLYRYYQLTCRHGPLLNKRFSAFSVSDQFMEHKQR